MRLSESVQEIGRPTFVCVCVCVSDRKPFATFVPFSVHTLITSKIAKERKRKDYSRIEAEAPTCMPTSYNSALVNAKKENRNHCAKHIDIISRIKNRIREVSRNLYEKVWKSEEERKKSKINYDIYCASYEQGK